MLSASRTTKTIALLYRYRGRPAYKKLSAQSFASSPKKTDGVNPKSINTSAQHIASVTQELRRGAETQQSVADWRVNTQGSDEWLHGPRPAHWWTGPKPMSTAGSLPFQDLKSVTRTDMRHYFDNTWVLTEMLFSGLKGEEPFYCPPYHDLRHPLIFYYGHTATFYVNKLRLAGLLDKPIEPYFESIFEVGVDEMRWDDLSKNHMQWPAVKDVHKYRAEVYKTVSDVIDNAPDFDSFGAKLQESPWWSLPMAFEHERIHLETSSVLMRELPLSRVQQPAGWPQLLKSNTESRWQQPVLGGNFPANELIHVEAGQAVLGKPVDSDTYGWDNEFGRKEMNVGEFKASKMQISNGEFYDFVIDGGYRDPTLWTDDGWGWCCYRNVRKPTFWVNDGPNGLNQFKLRTVFTEEPMQWDWPVIANYHEAKAYCTWKTRKDGAHDAPYRVLTEAEHHRMRDHADQDPITTSSNPANTNLVSGAERAVDGGPPSQRGFHDAFGNAWEWCEDHQSAFPGFEIHKLYDDFTLPCFDGEHNMIMGGSFISTGDQASKHARYQFRPHFFQHASFRLSQPLDSPWLETTCMGAPGPYARDQSPFRVAEAHQSPPAYLVSPDGLSPDESAADQTSHLQTQADYEEKEYVQRYLHLHFPSTEQQPPEWVPTAALDFPARCGRAIIDTAVTHKAARVNALDLGCGVGGAAFALADEKTGYASVTGVEFSGAFVDVANELKTGGEMSYQMRVEGDLYESMEAKVPDHVARDRLQFLQGDACSSTEAWSQQAYDAVLVGNLICRLREPASLLKRMDELVNPGGILMLTTPFSWKAEFTDRAHWLGGQQIGPRSIEAVTEVLQNVGFQNVESYDMPLAIRHHSRFYELIGAQATIWQNKK
jgi:5-histidylcysteine sulfoxide synthase/putative 4-mercaptohistidine N1-methyltranferase